MFTSKTNLHPHTKEVARQNSIPIMSKYHKTTLSFFLPTSFKLSVNSEVAVVSGFAFFYQNLVSLVAAEFPAMTTGI